MLEFDDIVPRECKALGICVTVVRDPATFPLLFQYHSHRKTYLFESSEDLHLYSLIGSSDIVKKSKVRSYD